MRAKKILALSSGGGHWVQLQRLLPAFAGQRLFLATTESDARAVADALGAERFDVVVDASRWSRLALLRSALQTLWLTLRVRPDVVISTGAAPGYFAVLFGKLVGARTIWVDSIANADELSLSGAKAGRVVDLWLTQWPHLARDGGPFFRGSVL